MPLARGSHLIFVAFASIFVVGCLVAGVACAGAAAPVSVAASKVRAAPTPSPQLLDAQLKDTLNQARLHGLQADELDWSKSPWSVGFRFASSVTGAIIGSIGALAAAAFALVTFLSNYRATQRAQRDTQFYEALKRFGDKDSTSLRASAVGLLAEMAVGEAPFVDRFLLRLGGLFRPRDVSEKRISREDESSKISRWRRNHYPYFDTVLNQYVSGLRIDTDGNVISTISDGLIEIAQVNTIGVFSKLDSLFEEIKVQFLTALAKFVMAGDSYRGPKDIGPLDDRRTSRMAGVKLDHEKFIMRSEFSEKLAEGMDNADKDTVNLELKIAGRRFAALVNIIERLCADFKPDSQSHLRAKHLLADAARI